MYTTMHSAAPAARPHAARWMLVALWTALLFMLAFASSSICLAHASEGGATITINSRQNVQVAFDAYHVFRADVTESGKASHLDWPSDEVKKATLDFLDSQGYATWIESKGIDLATYGAPQNAAEFIASMMGDSSADLQNDSKDDIDQKDMPALRAQSPQASTFALGLSRALAAACPASVATIQAGEPFVGEGGFWLVTSSQQTLSQEDTAGTSPLWVFLGRDDVEVFEKASVPALEKHVASNDEGPWSTVISSCRGQELHFRLAVTLPENLDAYDEYHMRLFDTLSPGLSLSEKDPSGLIGKIRVLADSKQVPLDSECLSIESANNKLVIDFGNLRAKGTPWENLKGGSTIQVLYQAHLNEDAVLGAAGNDNVARLEYTSDPLTNALGHTTEVTNRVFTFGLRLRKVDAQSGETLEGARFVLRAKDANQSGSYVQGNGSLGKVAYIFKTESDGAIFVKGIGAGSYDITEIEAPKGYECTDTDIHLSIDSELQPETHTLSQVNANMSAETASVEDISADEGIVTVCVKNTRTSTTEPRREHLAQTGVGPVAESLIGCGIACIALVAARAFARHRPHVPHRRY